MLRNTKIKIMMPSRFFIKDILSLSISRQKIYFQAENFPAVYVFQGLA